MIVPSSQTLIDKVIEHFQLHPEELGDAPKPVAREVLDKLTFSDRKSLPPSLKLWLAFDAKSLGLFSEQLIATPTSVSDWGGYAFNTLQRLLLPANSYNLYPGGGDSMWFLYTGQADEEGEYPVFGADVDDQYYVRLFAPNFAVWLADRHNVWDFNLYRWKENPNGYASLFEHPDYAPLMQKQSRLNFHDYQYCEIYGDAITVDGKPSKWCSQDDIIFDLKKQGFDDATINAILGKDY